MKKLFSRKTIICNPFLFIFGAFGYSAIEILWRGFTHWSMGVAGGTCFVIFGNLWEKLKKLPKIFIPVIGSGIITAVELVFGIVFNIILKKNIWDYSNLPFNFLGQISLVFSFLWGLLSTIFMPLAGYLRKLIIK